MPFTVLTGEWNHETNTFSVIPTTIKNFHEQYYLQTEEEIHQQRTGTKSVLGATYDLGEKYSWQLINTISASANPAGKVTIKAFEQLANQILDKCKGVELDGILLHLHGAMVSEEHEDAEGELLQRIRNIVGKEVPIIVTLDLHGNITKLMSELSTALIAVRTYPHIDYYEIALMAGELLQKTMLKEVKPITVIAKRNTLWGFDGGKTHEGSPMKNIIEKGEVLESSGQVLVLSACAGFTAADIYEIGPSVTVTVDVNNPSHHTDGDVNNHQSAVEYAQQIAEDCMDYCWETRTYKSEVHNSVDTMIALINDYLANTYPITKKPLVIADVTDNPGSGHYGDATNVLKALIDNDIPDAVFYAIYDPQAVLEGQTIGVGGSGKINLGGKMSKNLSSSAATTMGGDTLTLTGRVVTLSDGCFPTYGPMGFGGVWQNFGLSMLFRVQQTKGNSNSDVDVSVISNNGQLLDLAQITSLGCDPSHKKVIAVKSKHHFRACLSEIAGQVITVDGGGLGSAILNGGQYNNVRRPIWPLDK